MKDTTDKMKSVLVPEGSDFLGKSRINDSIYSLLNNNLKRDNSEFLKIESAISKSATVQATVIEKLFELKSLIPAGQASKINDIVKDLAKSIEIQGFGRTKLNSLRRETIVKSLNPEFKALLTTTSPGSGLLFGNELTDTLKEIESSNKISARLSFGSGRDFSQAKPPARPFSSRNSENTSFLGRGQASRKRGWHPNQRTYGGKRPYSHNDNRSRVQVKQR